MDIIKDTTKTALTVTLESWGITQQGNSRKDNQDSFLNWAECKLWAVADGVGGKQNGAAASYLIIRSLMQAPIPNSLDEHIAKVRYLLENANQLLRSQERVASSSASTVVNLLMHEGTAACLWAGDSRCYLLRSGVLYQCTKDHTLRQKKIDDGDLTVSEAKRMIKGNIITNAIGVRNALEISEVRFPIKAGDRYLLCSDGLSNLLSAEVLSTLLSRSTAKEAVAAISESLAQLLQPDNITFVVVFLSDA